VPTPPAGPPRITLLTDFGTRDGYVGALKGVLASSVPGILVDDIAHDLPPGDVRAASYALGRYWRIYPAGTVHLVVVDPGVGTMRRAMACQVDGRYLVAPDNGLATRALEEAAHWKAVEIARDEPPAGLPFSATFHGRDVFAPAAAVLARGGGLEQLGASLEHPVRLAEPRPEGEGAGGRGVVVAVDRFGNLLTNLPGSWLAAAGAAEVGGREMPVARTYGDVPPGVLAALVSSDGRVEIAMRDGSAAELTGLGIGARVRLRP
jgi:hypothetical protein